MKIKNLKTNLPKFLLLILLGIFFISTVSATTTTYAEWSDRTYSATIDNGQSIDFNAGFYASSPMTVSLYLCSASICDPSHIIHPFEDNRPVNAITNPGSYYQYKFSNTYTITPVMYGTSGGFFVRLISSDTGSQSEYTLYLTVNPTPAPVNNLPVITSSPVTSVNEGVTYVYPITATDADGNTLTYSLTENPTWLSIDSATGLISGTAPSVNSNTNYAVTVRVSDGITYTEQSYTLTVNNIPVIPTGNSPVITITGNNPATVQAKIPYVDAGATATDVEDGVLTASIIPTSNVNVNLLGTYAVVYSVTDSAGNTVTATRTVNVVDTTAPVITLIGSNPITITKGGTYTELGATVMDNYNTGLSATITGTVNTNAVGTYIITYTSADSSGNSAVPVTRTVNVIASGGGSSSSGTDNVVYSSTDVSGTQPSQDESETTSPSINLSGQKASANSIWVSLFALVSVLILGAGATIFVLIRRR